MHLATIRWTIALAVALSIAPAAAPAETEADAPAFVRPKYSPVQRQNEDWSALGDHDPATTGAFFDPIKHVKLADDGSIWASFGGHARLRFEVWDNFGFGRDNDDNFALFRATLHSDIHFGPNLRLFAEGITAGSTERDLPGDRRTLDADSLDLLQLFVDVKIPLGDDSSLTLRPGRQSLLFGNQRLVSPLPWANTIRAWDGVSAIWNCGHWTTTAFWTRFVPVQKYEFNDSVDDQFFGLYVTGPNPLLSDTKVDLYWLGRDRDGAAFNGTAGEEQRHTLGGRLYGPIGETAFDFEIEGAYQLGEVGAGDVDAFFVAAVLGYQFGEAPLAPRVWAGFDYASGDDATGGDVQTFNQLFPLGHAYFGYIDAIGRQNIIDLSGGVSVKPIERITLGLAGHLFWLADNDDALYNAGGSPIRPGGASDDHFVGAEIDLTAKWSVDRHTAVLIGYSQVFTGHVLSDCASHADTDFLYFQVQYTF